ncbi:DUF6094 domain-containing protein [Candidatus Viridilinea mediisalina]|nr:DUF6094 domain-containing protein [Candidatus Viridilinea mediisalina]
MTPKRIGTPCSAIGYRLSAIGYRLSAIGYYSPVGPSPCPGEGVGMARLAERRPGMAHGLHQNLLNEAFVRTPPCQTQKVLKNLLRVAGTATIFDPTCGEGDLLEPFAQAGHRIVGVELHRERASEAQQRMPDATIIASPLEAMRFDAPFADVLALNPPYFLQNGKRAEYTITKEALEYLRPGGIAFGVYPARSAWKADLVILWAKALRDVQVFRFPDGDPEDEFAFQKFTQIVVIGVKREQPLAEPDPGELARLRGFRYRKPDKETGSWWAGGTPPPILPDTPSEGISTVTPPRIPIPVSYTLMKADVAELLKALQSHGAHLDPSWHEDTTFRHGS